MLAVPSTLLIMLAFLVSFKETIASCYSKDLLRPDYAVDEVNVTSQRYQIVQDRFDTLLPGCTPLGKEVILVFVPRKTTRYSIQTNFDGVDTVLSLASTATGCVLTCNDDMDEGMFNSLVTADLIAGNQYTIVVETFANLPGNSSVSLSIRTVNSVAPTQSPSLSPSLTPPTTATSFPRDDDGIVNVFTYTDLLRAFTNATSSTRDLTLVLKADIDFLEPVLISDRHVRLVGGSGIVSLPLPITEQAEISHLINTSCVQSIGDTDGDGTDETVVCHSVDKRIYALEATSSIVITGDKVFALGDVDDDGFSDFAIFTSLVPNELSLVHGGGTKTSTKLLVCDAVRNFIVDVQPLGDLNGMEDFAVVFEAGNQMLIVYGNSRLFQGTKVDLVNDPVPQRSFIPLPANVQAKTVTRAGDLDGDDLQDFLIGIPSKDQVHVRFGPEGSGADVVIQGDIDQQFGHAVAGGSDLDGDGLANDFAVTAPNYVEGRGAVFVFQSSKRGEVPFWGARYGDMSAKQSRTSSDQDVITLYSATDDVLACGMNVLFADLDKDGRSDIVVLCNSSPTRVYIVFGRVGGFPQSRSLQSLANGDEGLELVLPSINATDSMSYDTRTGNILLLDATLHVVHIVHNPGHKRRVSGEAFFQLLGANASLTVENTRFVGSLKLATSRDNSDTNITVRNCEFHALRPDAESQEERFPCPQGSVLDASRISCEYCPKGRYCPHMTPLSPSASTLVTSEVRAQVFFGLPMSPYKIAASSNNAMVVVAKDGALYCKVLDGERENELVRVAESIAQKRKGFAQSLYGSAALLYDIISVSSNAFLVVYVDDRMRLTSRSITASTMVLSPPRIIATLTVRDDGDLAHTLSSSSDSRTGRVFFLVSSDAFILQAESEDGGTNWTVSTPPALQVPTSMFEIHPGYQRLVAPSAQGGHLASAFRGENLLVVYMLSYDSGTLRSFDDASNKTGLIDFADQYVYSLQLAASGTSFVLVANVEQTLQAFTYSSMNDRRWLRHAGFIANLAYNTLFHLYTAPSDDNATITYHEEDDSIVALSFDSAPVAIVSSRRRVLLQNVDGGRFQTTYDVQAWFVPSINRLLYATLVRDPLAQTKRNATVSDAELAQFAAYGYLGFPVVSSLFSEVIDASVWELMGFPCENCPAGSVQPLPVSSSSNASECEWGLRCSDNVVFVETSQTHLLVVDIMEGRPQRRVTLTVRNVGPVAIRWFLTDKLVPGLVLSCNTKPLVVNLGYRMRPGEELEIEVKVDATRIPPDSAIKFAWRPLHSRASSFHPAPMRIRTQVVAPLRIVPSELIYIRQSNGTVESTDFPRPVFIAYVSTYLFDEQERVFLQIVPCPSSPQPGWLSVSFPSSPFPIDKTSSSVPVSFSVDLSSHRPQIAEGAMPFSLMSCIGFRARSSTTLIAEYFANVTVVIVRECGVGTYSDTGTNVASTTRDGQCMPCYIGSYQDSEGSKECKPCPSMLSRTESVGSISITDCVPPKDFFRISPTLGAPCLLGANCTLPSELATLRLLPGYWRASPQSMRILKCSHEGYCVGGPSRNNQGRRRLSASSDLVCRMNHTGLLCESCTVGTFKRGSRLICEQCSSADIATDQGRFAGLVIGLLLLVMIGWIWLVYWVKQEGKFFMWMTKLKIVIGLLQVIALTVGNFPAAFPQEFASFAKVFGFFWMDMLHTLPDQFACAFTFVPTLQSTSLLVSTILPMIVLVVISLCHFFVVLLYENKQVGSATSTIVWFVLFLIYPGVSNVILRQFRCDNSLRDGVADGPQGLLVDPSSPCNNDGYLAYAGVMCALYVIGIPLAMAGSLLYRRNTRDNLLTAPYLKQYMFFDLVELVRKLLQSGLVLYLPTLTGQLAFEFLVTIALGFMAVMELKPYWRQADYVLALSCQVALFAIVFIAFLVVVDAGSASFELTTDINAWMFVLLFLPITLAVGQSVMDLIWSPPPRPTRQQRAEPPPAQEADEEDQPTRIPKPAASRTATAAMGDTASRPSWCCRCLNGDLLRKIKLGPFMGDFDSDIEDEEQAHVARNDEFVIQ